MKCILCSQEAIKMPITADLYNVQFEVVVNKPLCNQCSLIILKEAKLNIRINNLVIGEFYEKYGGYYAGNKIIIGKMFNTNNSLVIQNNNKFKYYNLNQLIKCINKYNKFKNWVIPNIEDFKKIFDNKEEFNSNSPLKIYNSKYWISNEGNNNKNFFTSSINLETNKINNFSLRCNKNYFLLIRKI